MVQIRDPWIALQFDNAVTLVKTVLENALNEMHKVGTEKDGKMEPVYSLEQLLDPEFKLPRPPSAQDKERAALGTLKAFARKSGGAVKVFKAKGGGGSST